MANLISAADGNLTSVATVWDPVSTGTGAVQQTRSSSTNTTTSYVYSSAFTGTVTDVVDGLLLYCQRLTSTGTIDVALSEDNGTTATRSVQINASDLPLDPGWVFFKFGSSLTLDGGTDYKVGVKGSSAGNAAFFRNGTAGNWARLLRRTGLTSAGAGDVMYIVGEHTGAGALTTRTITMDSTATTDYGTGSDGAADNGIEIGDGGVLTFGTTASTNYYLKLSGSLNVWANGTLNIGTTGTPVPRNGTAVLEFDPVADGGMGLIANKSAIVNIQGLSRTSGKNIVACKLNTDEAVNSTDLGVDTDTGWLDNDEIIVASTTRTASQTELGALNGNAGASSLTVDGFGGAGGGLANAHGGGGTTILSTPISAEIGLRTRNIKIRSATSTIMAYVYAGTTALVDIDWAEFYYIGENAANKRGIEIATTTGSFSMQYSSVHDTEDWGVYLVSTSGSNIVFSNNICDNLNTVAASSTSGLFVTASSGISTISNNYFFRLSANNTFATANYPIKLADAGVTFTNNVIISTLVHNASTGAINITESSGIIGSFDGNSIHSCVGAGIQFEGQGISGKVSNLNIWRMTGVGFYTGVSTVNGTNLQIIYDTGQIFGCTNNQMAVNNQAGARYIFRNIDMDNDPSFTTTTAFSTGNDGGPIIFQNCRFGPNNPHTNDFGIATTHPFFYTLINCLLNGTNEVPSQSSMMYPSFVRSHKHDQVATAFKNFYRLGTIQADQTTRHTASGYSWKMTPTSATNKLILPGPEDIDTFKVAVKANQAVTINVYVQKDGSYNGNAPRLVVIGRMIAGVDTDQIASLSVGASTWEQLQVTVTPTEDGWLEYYVDCDGTAGNIYVDDISISQA